MNKKIKGIEPFLTPQLGNERLQRHFTRPTSSIKTILVTGGAGFIGSNTVKMLCDQNYTVKIVDNLSTGYKKLIDPRATFIKCSIVDTKKMLNALQGVDAVIHFAATSTVNESIKNPSACIENNITNGILLLEAMKKTNVKKIIFSSSASVYGVIKNKKIKETDPKHPLNPYGASKLSFENILSSYYHCYGLESVSLRYFNAYGPRDEQKPATRAVPVWTLALLKNKPIPLYWQGKQIRDYVFVKDIARAHIDVLNLDGYHVFNVGSGRGIVMKKLLDEIAKILKLKPKILHKGKRVGDPDSLIADISLIQKTVGWKPKYSLHEGLKETLDYYKKRSK